MDTNTSKTSAPSVGPPRLALLGASKTFGAVKVLSDVSLVVAPGEIHGLVGQNGSGKSTLIKVLSGVHRPDQGTQLLIDGHEAPLPVAPRFLLRHGLAFVHQNLGLELGATVTENVRIGRFRPSAYSRRIEWGKESAAVERTLEHLGQSHIDPFAVVQDLNHADRASVAIARALQTIDPGKGCIVFDETTQSLPRSILAEFYAQVRGLAAAGTSVVIVSHRIPEILALCDRVTVLDSGHQTAAGVPVSELDEKKLTRLITGHTRTGTSVRERSARDWSNVPVAMEMRDVAGGAVEGVSLAVRRGEILGITGDPDSGFDEIPDLISAVSRNGVGDLVINGRVHSLNRVSVRKLIRNGMVYVPSDRTGKGVALPLMAGDNVSLPRFRRRGRPWFLGRRWMDSEFDQSVANLGITPHNRLLPAAAFSGGNQQKLLLSKWLLDSPSVVILHEPVQAVDVGAREDILAAIQKTAGGGAAVVLASLEADDLARVCDRVIVLRHGQINAELAGDSITPSAIISAVYDSALQEQLP